MSIFLIFLAILPGLLICFLLFKLDKFEKEPILHLSICFALGILCCFPAMKLEMWGDQLGYDENQGIGTLLVFSYIVVALSEELVKYLVLVFYPFQRKFFNEPLDGIIYAVMIGMGFATLENILYADRFGLQTIIVRAFTAVPAHAVFAIIMGYYVGLAKFDLKNRKKYLAFGLLIPVLIHGTYDVFILQEYYEWLMVLATLTLSISTFFAYRVIRLHQQSSPFKDYIPEVMAIATTATSPSKKSTNNSDNEIMDEIIAEMDAVDRSGEEE